MRVPKTDKNLIALIEKSVWKRNMYLPLFYRLSKKTDQKKFDKLIENEPKIEIFDEIEGQLVELIKSLNPKIELKKNPGLLEKKVLEHIGNTPIEKYGVWVYYPWSSRLLHVLDEEEFIEVRTNRNQYKITKDERKILVTKKVGVMGLSVGQAVAITMAMERGFGEIRLADFDALELTNYNRIRTGLHNMGINKAISTAREIAEIDPFLKVRCFTQGITEENIQDFLTKDGKLDLLIDECDGLDIKILARTLAKKLCVPVIMEASDRSAIDVERFDLEPDRPILHGWLEHLDITKVKEAKTNEEKIPFLLAMMKMDTVSPKFKATMLEIEQTVTTWPQLASEVTGGGAIMTNIARRINLGQFNDSGRYYIDIDELITDKNHKKEKENYIPDPASIPPPPITKKEMKEIAEKIDFSFQENQIELNKETVEKIVTFASMAPSGANNQPWKWMYKKGLLLLFHDKSRSVSFIDYNNIGANISFGATLENITLKARKMGFKTSTKIFSKSHSPLVASVLFFNNTDTSSHHDRNISNDLASYIDKRSTNRQIVKKTPIENDVLNELKKAVHTIEKADVIFLQNEDDIKKSGKVISMTERLRFMHPTGYKEFFENELRWTKEQNEQMKDGIDLGSLDLTLSEQAGMLMAKDERVIKLLRQWQKGTGFERLSQKTIGAASAIGVITMPSINSVDCINGGKALQRLWLTATKNNIQLHPFTTPIFLFARLIHGKGKGMTEEMSDELNQNKEQYFQLLTNENKCNIFLFRLFPGSEPKVRSLRRSIKDILSFET